MLIVDPCSLVDQLSPLMTTVVHDESGALTSTLRPLPRGADAFASD